jgi:hypothetical protein
VYLLLINQALLHPIFVADADSFWRRLPAFEGLLHVLERFILTVDYGDDHSSFAANPFVSRFHDPVAEEVWP